MDDEVEAHFKLRIHFSGQFDKYKFRYTGGETYDQPVNDLDRFCYWDIKDAVNKLGFQSFTSVYYKMCDLSMRSKLKLIKGDNEVMEVCKILESNGICDIYVEHEDVNEDNLVFDDEIWETTPEFTLNSKVATDSNMGPGSHFEVGSSSHGATGPSIIQHKYKVNEALEAEGLAFLCETQPDRERVAFLDGETLGSDGDDVELVDGIEKYKDRIGRAKAILQEVKKNRVVTKGLENVRRPTDIVIGKEKEPSQTEKNPGCKDTDKGKGKHVITSRRKGRFTDQSDGYDTLVPVSNSEEEEDYCSSRDSQYIDSDDLGSYYSDSPVDDDECDSALRRPSTSLCYNPNSEHVHFEIGMKFENVQQFKAALANYSVQKGCKLKWKKNEPGRQRIICQEGCEWELFASYDRNDDCLKVKTYKREHTCYTSYYNNMVTCQFLAEYFKTRIEACPNMKSTEMMDQLKVEIDVITSRNKCRRAKKMIQQELEGNYKEEYRCLRGWGEELLRSNSGSTCVITTDQSNPEIPYQFQRIYICMAGCKKGWKAGCRPIMGVDGTFLKGICKGVLLTAIGRDGNDQMFPLAWAVVEGESKDSWEWFMDLLSIDIENRTGAGLTIISDMHKGIIAAKETVFPYAKHRYCARHIYANWQKIFRGDEYKKHFWLIARATWEAEFDTRMTELAKISELAKNGLKRYPAKFWCKAFFDFDAICDVVDNNMCEAFNFWIMEARYKSIISMLDEIRIKVMERIAYKLESVERWRGDIAPRPRKKLDDNRKESNKCRLHRGGRGAFEVRHRGSRFVVSIEKKTCSCRSWKLTGIPCPHAICVMLHGQLNPENYVDECYKKKKYIPSYSFPLYGMEGTACWKKFIGEPVQPPEVRVKPGRPKTARRKGKNEPIKGKTKLSRVGRIMTCTNCGKKGHNKKSCSSQAIESSSQGHSTIAKPKRPSGAYHRRQKGVIGNENQVASFSQEISSQVINPTPNQNTKKRASQDKNTNPSSSTKDKGKAKVIVKDGKNKKTKLNQP